MYSMNAAAAVRFALDMVGSPYVYGASNKPCTPAMRRGQMRQYPGAEARIRANCPVLSGRADGCGGCLYEGKAAFDCAQLTRFALQASGISLPSGASSQWKADLFSEKGELPVPLLSSHVTMRLPCLVFRRDPMGTKSRPMAHVGLSLGDGRAVDARSHRQGVVLSPLASYPWTHYALPRGFQAEEEQEPAENLRIGARGEAVLSLQRGLLRLGFPLPRYGTDGIFGWETAAAVRAFQHARNLPPTGIADSLTMNMMERGNIDG